MKTKIQIRSLFGKILFEFEKENNTQKETVIEAVKTSTNLTNANLTGADLIGADLTGAYLTSANLAGADLRDTYLTNANLTNANLAGADLTGADLTGAYLTGANLAGADLTGADLTGAYLTNANLTNANLAGAYLAGADLTGADLRDTYLRDALYTNIKIKKIAVFTGLYKYTVVCIISENGEKYIKLGCYFRKLEEWEQDFWNNTNEFPDNNSEKSKLRLFAFETAKKWFDIIDE